MNDAFPHQVFLTWEQAALDDDRRSPGHWADGQFGLKGFAWIVDDEQTPWRLQRGITYGFAQPEHAFAFKMRFG
jgi:hypothetical protein